MNITGFKTSIAVSKDNTCIIDSYLYNKIEMDYTISALKKIYNPESNFIITKRSKASQIREWKSHNLLYNLHLFRNHTKDVDLNKEHWYSNAIYYILSTIYNIFY